MSISPEMKAMIDAPLADAVKINLPAGKRPAPRSRVEHGDDIGCPKVSARELQERRKRAAQEKLDKLFDYYAGTKLDASKVAEHMGLYRQEQTGTDDKGKPVFTKVLDVERASVQLEWRRAR
jgi:hypothetical protein